METVFVAMSGGIDSSFTAYLLKQKGYKVIGITFQLLPETIKSTKNPKACCSIEAVMRAKKIADNLSIPHYVINLRKEFEEHVIENFLNEYKSGRTPNPCVLCNKHIKFLSFLNKALSIGADKIATGHYAIIDSHGEQEGEAGYPLAGGALPVEGATQAHGNLFSSHGEREGVAHRALPGEGVTQAPVIDDLSGSYMLKKGSDKAKDQSYFLYPIEESFLKYILFPLGPFTKNSVRKSTGQLGWNLNNIKESQDVCFIPENDYRDFLSNYLQLKKGPIYHSDGKLMGTHNGIHLYTIGQRRGLNIPYREPLYVTKIIPDENSLIVGPKEYLKRTKLIANDINFFYKDLPDLFFGNLSAKVRYRQKEEPCMFTISGDLVEVTFDNPIYSITPGQSVVIYSNDKVVGGGIIKSSE